MKSTEKTSGKEEIRLKISTATKPGEDIELAAYMFNAKGQLTHRVKVTGNEARLPVSEKELRSARVFIAPVSKNKDEEKEVSLREMTVRKAYEPVLTDLKDRIWEPLPIPDLNIGYWLLCACRVKGRLVKPVNVDGDIVEMPVCHARVHICEVDKISLIIPTLPDWVIDRFRDIIVNFPEPIPNPIPDPIPDPFPDPVPPPFPGPDPMPFFREGMLNLRKEVEAGKVKPLSTELRQAFVSTSTTQIRKTIVENYKLLHPYLCWYPKFWPYLYSCSELRVVHTDQQGRFDTTVFYPCAGDKPDLYFWVEYSIGGTWTTVYKPSKPCHTYWNYACGTEVVIRLTDPRVDACGTLDTAEGSDSVEIVKIGDAGYVSHIQQNMATSVNIQGEALRTVGLTNLSGNGNQIRPFGATLGLRVKFGSGLPSAGGATHYRWSYRKVADSGLNPDVSAWSVMDHPVHINYYEEDGNTFHKKAYPLGPDPDYSETVFKIPPRYAAGIDVPNPGGRQRQWALEAWNSAVLNTLFSGSGDSDRLTDAGLYEFRFELIRMVGGNPQVVVVDNEKFQIPPYDLTPNYTSVNAPAIHLIPHSPAKASGFVMKVRVDNNRCQADIHPVSVNAAEANVCGFVEYADKQSDVARLSFKAYHPNNFANLTFRVRKGTETYPNGTPRYRAFTQGMVIGDTIQGYVRAAGGEFGRNVPVADLLGACTDAAFGEHLYVDALATNGSTSELGYDASSLAGFALKNTP